MALAVLLLLALSVLAGIGTLLANAYSASQVARNARALHWSNAAVGSTAVARASIAQAVFFSSLSDTNPQEAEDAIAEARTTLETVVEARSRPEANAEIVVAFDAFLDASALTIEYAETGQVVEADFTRRNDLETTYEDLSDLLAAEQSRLVGLIADAEQSGNRVSQITFVSIAFLIPAVTILVFWFVLRQRMKRRESRMRGIVEKERDLNRAKDELIAGLSHELRTPITSILGFSQLLLDDDSLPAEATELIRLISDSSSDLSRMVNDLLIAARIDAGALTMELAEVDLADEATAVAALYQARGDDIAVNVPSLKAYADPLRVRQAIHNLVSNAIRHGGDRVILSARDGQRGPVLVVADNGPGIPDDMEGKVFERFAHKGRHAVVAGSVGLGLAICKELAVQMGGDLEYKRVDGWTTFNLRLRPYIGDLTRRGMVVAEIEATEEGTRTEVSI